MDNTTTSSTMHILTRLLHWNGSSHHPWNMQLRQTYVQYRNKPTQQTTFAGISFLHIISGCIALVPTKYLQRHDKVCKYIHMLLLLDRGIINTKVRWYDRPPTESSRRNPPKFCGNFQFRLIILSPTTSPIEGNHHWRCYSKRPQPRPKASRQTTCIYWPLCWNQVIMEPSEDDYTFENLKLEQNEMQKIALLGAAHIVRSFLQIAWFFLLNFLINKTQNFIKLLKLKKWF